MIPDLTIARAFVEALTGSPDTIMRWRLIDDKRKGIVAVEEFDGTVAQSWARFMAAQEEGAGIFYFLNEVLAGDFRFARDSDVTRVRAIPADFDNGFPEDWEWLTPPDLLVHTSAGRGQALWVCEPPTGDFKALCRRVIEYYHSDPAVKNLSRILRLPGTLHLKGEPQLVTWERYG
jgi:hypothetical protein